MQATVLGFDPVEDDGMQRVQIFVKVSGGRSGSRDVWVDTHEHPQFADLIIGQQLEVTFTRSAKHPDRELIVP